MSHALAQATIKQAWLTVWSASPLAAIPVEHQNLVFVQPSTGPWGRLTLICGKSNPASLGTKSARVTRVPFSLTLQFFMPENRGTLMAMQAADAMSGLDFQSVKAANVKVAFSTSGAVPSKLPKSTPDPGYEMFDIDLHGHYDIYT